LLPISTHQLETLPETNVRFHSPKREQMNDSESLGEKITHQLETLPKTNVRFHSPKREQMNDSESLWENQMVINESLNKHQKNGRPQGKSSNRREE